MARNEIIKVRVDKNIKDALQAFADRDPEVTVSTIIRRAILRELGLSQGAIGLWEAEERGSAAIEILKHGLNPGNTIVSRGAAALISKALELTPEEQEDLEGLRSDVDELKDIMKKVDKKFGGVTMP